MAGADLVSYTSCSQLLQQVKAEALKEVGPYGLPGSSGDYYGLAPVGVVRPGPLSLAAPTTAGAAPSANAPTTVSGSPQGYSTTNDQEAGVDEPDIVKTNGQVMAILRQDPLGVQVLDVSGSTPTLDGFLPLPQLAEADGIFLVGQDVYVIGSGPATPVPVRYVGGSTAARPAASRPPGRAGQAGQAVGSIVAPGTIMLPPILPWGGAAFHNRRCGRERCRPAEPECPTDLFLPGCGPGRSSHKRPGRIGLDEPTPVGVVVPCQLDARGGKICSRRQQGLDPVVKDLRLVTVRDGHQRSRQVGHQGEQRSVL